MSAATASEFQETGMGGGRQVDTVQLPLHGEPVDVRVAVAMARVGYVVSPEMIGSPLTG
jgi:hypothetical protein